MMGISPLLTFLSNYIPNEIFEQWSILGLINLQMKHLNQKLLLYRRIDISLLTTSIDKMTQYLLINRINLLILRMCAPDLVRREEPLSLEKESVMMFKLRRLVDNSWGSASIPGMT
jgi:hypothetical protein